MVRLLKSWALPALLSLALGSAALAQTDAFEAEMEALLTPAEDRASLLRCAALFRAFRLYAGEDTELGQAAQEREQDVVVFTTMIWQSDEGLEMEAAMDQIVPLITDATELFITRMVENSETGGTVFDPELEDEVGYCNALRNTLMEALE